eukprot:365611-Chlamydomonas_euryale.AAC.14
MARPNPPRCQLGRTLTSQMVALSTPSDVARANATIWPSDAYRVLRVARAQTSACVFSSATFSLAGSRRGKPTCIPQHSTHEHVVASPQ